MAGLDRSPDMLAVARRKLPDLDLREGRAEALPFEDDTFDAVTCQFGLMFFDDRDQAWRRCGGSCAEAAGSPWLSGTGSPRTPGYAALTELVERHLGGEAGEPIRAAFALGDLETVRSLLLGAEIASVDVNSVDATARFPSLRAWVDAEVRGWVGGDFGEEEYAALVEEAEVVLAPYDQPDGTVEFALPAIVATGSKP